MCPAPSHSAGADSPTQHPCPLNGPHTHGPCRPPAGAWKTMTRRKSGRWQARQPSPPGAEEAEPRAGPRCGLALSASRPAHRPTTAAAWPESHCACAPGTVRSPATTPRRPERAPAQSGVPARACFLTPSRASFDKPKTLCAQLSHKERQFFFFRPLSLPPPGGKDVESSFSRGQPEGRLYHPHLQKRPDKVDRRDGSHAGSKACRVAFIPVPSSRWAEL